MYNALERRVGRILDSFPRLRQLAKLAYQRANYYVHARPTRPAVLDSAVTMRDQGADGAAAAGAPATFYGYFGISPWSRDGCHFLLHRLPDGRATAIDVCVRDERSGTIRKLADSRAWNYQQGSMAQWMQSGGSECVVFNDYVDRRLVCVILSLDGARRELPWPVQAVHPSGTEALSINYRRLWRLRPEYGYDVDADNFAPDAALRDDGIWRVGFDDGAAALVVSLEQLAGLHPRPEMTGAEHKVNHLLYSPSGDRFLFMHRWLGAQGKYSRLYSARSDGSDLRLLLDDRMVSHYAWRGDDTVLVWARAADDGDRYYLLDAASGRRAVLGRDVLDRYGDGHPSFSPDGRWLVTDSYPDRARRRHLLLFDCAADRLVEVGTFFAPWRYDGAVRCDLHPRWSPDGRSLSIDSAHEGTRRCYALDVSGIVAR